jgi:aminopeptidase N
VPGTNLTRTEAQTRSAHIRVDSYHVVLDLTGSDTTFTSVCTIRFSCAQPGARTCVDLIAPHVRQITLNGVDLKASEVFADSRIKLTGLQTYNELMVHATCAYTNSGEGLHRFTDPTDGEVYLYSQFEVADTRRVFAVFEQPDIKAAFEFEVHAPAGWRVISNQPEVVATDMIEASGDIVHRFPPTPPIACYLTAIVAGPYASWHDALISTDGRPIALGLYARKSLAQYVDAAEIFDVTKRGFAFYEPAFDFPYPYTKYDQLFVPEFNAGAMENVGAVTITESYVFRSAVTEARVERRAVTILHELAHMWFGDLVTMRWWNDLWLNESFAEYASHLAAANATRWTSAWTTFASVEKTWAYRQDQLPSTHPIMADIRDLQDVMVNFDGITYAKGASVLRQLVAWVGEEAFLTGISAYFKTYAWGNATLADLLAELETASGRDLSTWSELWLKTAGVDTIRPNLTLSDDDSIAALSLSQYAPDDYPVLRPHRIGIGGYEMHGAAMVREWFTELDVAGEVTEVSVLAGRARPAVLLIDDADMAYAKVRLDSQSAAAAVEHLGDFEDPLARAVIWTSLWDQTRDAEIPARGFVRLVLRWIAVETSSSTTQVLLQSVATALRSYVHPSSREALTAEAAEIFGRLVDRAIPGSDTQLHLLTAFVTHARTSSQLSRVGRLLNGSESLSGRTIDTDLGWNMLFCLVRSGAAGEAAIAARLAGDPSAAGHVWAARLRAALPTVRAKHRAWLAATTDLSLANEIQAATIAGFTSVVDRSLLVPYVEPYFELLERTWAGRSLEMATNIVQGLYPSLLADDWQAGLLGRTDAWLAQLGSRTPALRRLVVEARADVERALAVQARDCE